MTCKYCKGVLGRCMPYSIYCRTCYDVANCLIDVDMEYQQANRYVKASLKHSGVKRPGDLPRHKFPKYCLKDVIDRLIRMVQEERGIS